MRHHTAVAFLALGFIVGLAGPMRLLAQDRADFTQLQTTLKQDDKLEVTTTNGVKVQGRILEVTAERIVLKMKDGTREIAASEITKVQRRKNGVLLGALIGAGAGVPVALL